jgi:hypothetical protein
MRKSMISIQTGARLLADLLWPTFVRKGGCVILASACPEEVAVDHILPDRTAVESFHNHVHVLAAFRHAANLPEEPFFDSQHPDFRAACSVGKLLAALWSAKLSQDYPSEQFLIYFSERDDPSVRFHGVHPGEQPWLDPSDWPEDVAAGRIVVFHAGQSHAKPPA